MAPKRKSDGVDSSSAAAPSDDQAHVSGDDASVKAVPPPAKKRKSEAKADSGMAGKTWKDITIEGEDEGQVQIYDNCNEIRRKIRALQKEPGFKITHWLKEIGSINSNSYGRFMKASGPAGGAENGTYEAAYLYFEKNRILKGKKKAAKRQRNERESRGGLSRHDGNRPVWTFAR